MSFHSFTCDILISYNSLQDDLFIFPAEQMLFYVSLTTFRMLSISFAIITLGYIAIPLYVFLLLGITVIGYVNTSKDGDFIVRGLISALTTGDSDMF